ncbi:MAG: GAF domain-containing protein [Alphaproteobacteria bacterium]|nr:GAF domain-containing protein [Alphaproteobacteria bacterium]
MRDLSINTENTLEELLERILLEAKKLSNADGATLYTLGDDTRLHFSIIINDTLKLHMGGSSSKDVDITPLDIYDPETGEPNTKNVCANVFNKSRIINVHDVYASTEFDFSKTLSFDEQNNYETHSILTVPLKNIRDDCIAVMQLINAKDETGKTIPFSSAVQRSVEIIAMHASILVENNRLLLEHRKVLESLIELVARAIDTKSPYTGAHCQRVPVITKMLASAAVIAGDGPFKDFELSDDQWYTLHLASWLHDCGKVTTPEYVMDKATKLETVHNRIHEIRLRFEVLRRDAQIKYLEAKSANPEKEAEYKKAYEDEIKALNTDFAFLARCNIGNSALTPMGMERIKQIGKRTYTRTFDRSLGLSRGELNRTDIEEDRKVPATEYLLEDRAEHLFGGYNRGEVYNLSILVGTLNAEERAKINDHVRVTLEMLKAIPFPDHYKGVVEYAASHHERVDGKGYPRGLTKEQMSVPARIIAIADVFEALSSTDRPYKKIKKLSEIIAIMSDMSKNGHIDPDLFQLFLTSEVYREYAKEYMLPEQFDDPDITPYLTSPVGKIDVDTYLY